MVRMKRTHFQKTVPGAVALLLVLPACALAQLRLPPPTADSRDHGFTWSLGASVVNGPSYAGSAERSTGVRPVIGLEIGRFTLSSGGGGSLLDFDLDARDSGLTARLFSWTTSASVGACGSMAGARVRMTPSCVACPMWSARCAAA